MFVHNIYLQGETVLLRPYSKFDASKVVDLRNTMRAQYYLNQGFESTIETQKKWQEEYFKRENDYYWVIECRETGDFIGTTALYNINSGQAEKGRLIVDEEKSLRKPYVLEAELLVIKFAVETLKIKHLITTTKLDNQKMKSINERFGFNYTEKKLVINNETYELAEFAKKDSLIKIEKILKKWVQNREIQKQPLVSIVISAYNHENYIEECLNSIIDQTYSNIELIIYNDGSTDKTHEKIEMMKGRLESRFTDFYYINKKNEGISKNFNIGIKRAKGKYIKTFASDDYLFPKAIEFLVEGLEDNPDFDISYADGYYVYLKDGRFKDVDLNRYTKFSDKVNYFSGNIHEHLYDILPHMSSWTVLFRKKCFEHYGYYDENLTCEDMDIYLRFSKESKFLYLNEDVAIHRLHDNNAGYNPTIMIPSIKKMINKYNESNFFEKEIHRRKLSNWLIFTERSVLPLSFEHLDLENKKIIVWGTGGYCKGNIHLLNKNVEYFVDSDAKKLDMIFLNKPIKSPESILKEKKEEIFIIVLSTFIDEIYSWLIKNGLQIGVNFY